jgi:hypothetical protein
MIAASPDHRDRFPLPPTLAGLLALGAALYFTAGLVLPMFTGGMAVTWTAALLWTPALAVIGTAALLLIAVACLWRFGPLAAAKVWMLAMLLRMGLALGAGWWLKVTGDWPGLAIGLSLAIFYLPALTYEAAIIGTLCWREGDEVVPKAGDSGHKPSAWGTKLPGEVMA